MANKKKQDDLVEEVDELEEEDDQVEGVVQSFKKTKYGPPNANYTGKVYNSETGKFAKYVNGEVVK